MSRLFNDPTKTEESFQILNQLKDVKIWKILTSLLDPSTSFSHASTHRVIKYILNITECTKIKYSIYNMTILDDLNLH